MKRFFWWFLCLLPAMATAGDFGRLLTTPEERARIEAYRRGQVVEGDGTGKETRVTVNGIFKASDGRRLVWLNGRAHDGRSRRSPAVVRYDGRVRLALERRGSVLLKPGQTLDKATGRIYDATEQPPAEPADRATQVLGAGGGTGNTPKEGP